MSQPALSNLPGAPPPHQPQGDRPCLRPSGCWPTPVNPMTSSRRRMTTVPTPMPGLRGRDATTAGRSRREQPGAVDPRRLHPQDAPGVPSRSPWHAQGCPATAIQYPARAGPHRRTPAGGGCQESHHRPGGRTPAGTGPPRPGHGRQGQPRRAPGERTRGPDCPDLG